MSDSQNERFRRVDAVFDAALDLPTDAQTAFIDRACAHDPDLRAEVLQLLLAHRRSTGFLELSAAKLAAGLLERGHSSAQALPDRVGPFNVVRVLGQGGMGQVLLGERADGQFEQRVAIKVIQQGVYGLVPRFMKERRILALLEHPNIARLIDGGITEDGLPYFAMEFVEGEPIDHYCDAHEVSLEDRLELVASVCAAVSYAHQHLVIHRDLKPSNILVTQAGQVKLLDFGIAKLLGTSTTADDTRAELRIMTPEFAAPEQVRGDSISTATDVYSLGVLLYLLVTGERPYELRGKSPAEIEGTVCEFQPERPSSKALPGQRRRVSGDLDLIVMMALQKDPRRRYQSPAALAEDLQRYRAGHPILARPDSVRYRTRKFVGRHRTGVSIAALFLLSLVAAVSRERVLRGRAELETRKAHEVEEFLVRVFGVADPNAWQSPDGGSTTARVLLDRGAARIDSTLVEQPEVQAELRSVLGRVYTNLGLFDKAAPLLERALAQHKAVHGPVHASVAQDLDLLGTALMQQDKYEEAGGLLRSALEQRRRLLGLTNAAVAESAEHLATLHQRRNEYGAAEALHQEAFAIRQRVFGDSTVEVANSLNNLGLIRFRKGEFAEAEVLYRRALAIQIRRNGENHPGTAATMQNLAQTLQFRGNLVEAESYYRRSLAAKRAALGDLHPSVTISLNNLGNLLARTLGRLDEGEALTREALALDRKLFGERHSYVAQSLANLAVILRLEGNFTEAEKLLRQALDINRELFGDVHQSVATVNSHLAQTLFLQGAEKEGLQLNREALSQYRQVFGDNHIFTLTALGNLARMLEETGNTADADSILQVVLQRLDPEKPEHRTQYALAQRTLGDVLLVQGRIDEALPLLDRALALARQQFGESSLRTAEAQLTYGDALLAKGRRAEAEPLLRAAQAILQQHRKAQPRMAARADAALASLSGR